MSGEMFSAKWASDPWVQFVRYFGIISDPAECSLCSNTVKLEIKQKEKSQTEKNEPIFKGMRTNLGDEWSYDGSVMLHET